MQILNLGFDRADLGVSRGAARRGLKTSIVGKAHGAFQSDSPAGLGRFVFGTCSAGGPTPAS